MIKSLPQENLVSIGVAAKQLFVSEQTLRQLTDQNRIDAFVTEGGHRRYKTEDIVQLEAELKAAQAGRSPSDTMLTTTFITIRQGDNYYVYDFQPSSEYHQDLASFDYGSIAIEQVKGKGNWSDYPLLSKTHIETKLYTKCLYQGGAHMAIEPFEINADHGETTSVEQWIRVMAPSKQELIEISKQAASKSLLMLQELEPVISIVTYKHNGKAIERYAN